MKIGIVIADDNEYKPMCELALSLGGEESVRRSKQSIAFSLDSKRIIAVKCGIGKVNAAAAAAYLIAEDEVDAIMSIGLSGSVSGLFINDIVAGTSYTECDFDLSPLGFEKGVKPQEKYVYSADETLLSAALSLGYVKKAVCGCGDFFLADKEKKHEYFSLFGINEFDMETGAVASVCSESGVPFLALRQISDTADDVAAESYKGINDACPANLTQTVCALVKKL